MRISDWSSDVCSSDLSSMGLPLWRADVHLGLHRHADAQLVGAILARIQRDAHRPALHDLGEVASGVVRGNRRVADRTSVVEGKSGAALVDVGGRRLTTKTKP